MCSQVPDNGASGVLNGTVSRRRPLAAAGVVAIGGVAGCLNQVAARATNTGASPAAIPPHPERTLRISSVVRLHAVLLGAERI